MLKKLFLLMIVLGLAAGAWYLQPTPHSSAANTSEERQSKTPAGQLPDTITPLGYQIDLHVDPAKDGFTGAVTIRTQLNNDATSIWLHGQGLKVSSATVTTSSGEQLAAHYAEQGDSGVALLRFPRQLSAQALSLHFDYEAPFDRALNGLYLVEDGGERYAFTQMESHFARKAFPGFDEPRFKVPFGVSLTVRNEYVAIANTPLAKTEDLGNGLKKLSFAISKPLPTYLLAWAVGKLDVVEWKPIPISAIRDREIPLRGVATHGKGVKLDYALENTAGIVQALEDYFRIPYPYEKLDILAVPDFEAGAMENAGAITYREQLLLLDDNSALQDKRSYVVTHTHELAHQWFGDLVTMPWWNDIWLNEAFASWMEGKIVRVVEPTMGFEVADQIDASRAMRLDALASMREIRQPILCNDDISSAFDGISYSKGAAVIAMFENFVGAEVFQRGVTAYLTKYQWGNATSEQFVAAIAEAAGDDRVSPAFFSFLTQVGVPEIAITAQCDAGKVTANLKQSRYLPLGSKAAGDQRWQVPVCISAYGDFPVNKKCTLLTAAEQEWRFELPSCPTHMMPNADGGGYYRFTMTPSEHLASMSRLAELPLAEAVVLVDNLAAGFKAGRLDVNAYLAAMPSIAVHPSREVATMPLDDLEFIRDYLTKPEDRSKLEQMFTRLYQPRLDAIGLTPNFDESADVRLLRTTLIGFLADTARSEKVRAPLREWGRAYIGFGTDNALHENAVPSDLVGMALVVASQDLGADYFKALNVQLDASNDGNVRDNLIFAIASVEDPELAAKARDMMLGMRLRTNERFYIAYGQMGDPVRADAMFQWFKGKYALLRPMFPEGVQKRMPMLARSYCSPEREEEVRTYFEPLIAEVPGGERSLNNVLEGIALCHALVQAQPAIQL